MLGLLGIGNFLGHVHKVWRALRLGSLTLNSIVWIARVQSVALDLPGGGLGPGYIRFVCFCSKNTGDFVIISLSRHCSKCVG